MNNVYQLTSALFSTNPGASAECAPPCCRVVPVLKRALRPQRWTHMHARVDRPEQELNTAGVYAEINERLARLGAENALRLEAMQRKLHEAQGTRRHVALDDLRVVIGFGVGRESASPTF